MITTFFPRSVHTGQVPRLVLAKSAYKLKKIKGPRSLHCWMINLNLGGPLCVAAGGIRDKV